MKRAKYEEVRHLMKPGDVIAFGGKGHFSEIVKFATFSQVSHVGVILQTKIVDDDSDRHFNQIIESTSLDGFNGVNVSRFSDRLSTYDGELWWLPLHNLVRDTFNTKDFFNFLFNHAKNRTPYDTPQAIKSALDLLDKYSSLTRNTEDFGKMFCSELVAAGLEIAGAIPPINASEVTPIELCRWSIYDRCVQISGEDMEISRFNSIPL